MGRGKALPSLVSSEIFFVAPTAFLISCFSQPEDPYTGVVSALPFGQELAFFLDSRIQIRFVNARISLGTNDFICSLLN